MSREEIKCSVASYGGRKRPGSKRSVTNALSIRFPLELTEYLNIKQKYSIETADRESVILCRDGNASFRLDGSMYCINFGSSSFQPKLGYFGSRQGIASVTSDTSEAALSIKIIGMVSRNEKPFSHIEPIVEPIVEPTTGHAQILETLDSINLIESHTRYRLKFDSNLRRWVFTDTIE
jgi:hypothetical protein